MALLWHGIYSKICQGVVGAQPRRVAGRYVISVGHGFRLSVISNRLVK